MNPTPTRWWRKTKKRNYKNNHGITTELSALMKTRRDILPIGAWGEDEGRQGTLRPVFQDEQE